MPKEVIDMLEIDAEVERRIFSSSVVNLSATEHAGQDGGSQNIGWHIDEGNGVYREVPRYTQEMKAALKIMEALGARILLASKGDGLWIGGYRPDEGNLQTVTWTETYNRPAMAITMAALSRTGGMR